MWAVRGKALPLDLRRWLCPAVHVLHTNGASPLVRPQAQITHKGPSPTEGIPDPKGQTGTVGRTHLLKSSSEAEADRFITFERRNPETVSHRYGELRRGFDISMKWQGIFVSMSGGKGEVPVSTYPRLR